MEKAQPRAGVHLSKRDSDKRELVLGGSLWRVLMTVGAPLALYESLSQIFKILDTMMASHISAASVSAVAYLSQITLMLASVGGGLAVGSSIKISEAFGAGDYPLVRRRVSTLFVLCAALGALAVGLTPFTGALLRAANTPDAFIAEGAAYFNIGLIDLAVCFFNNAYIAVERARGNASRILWLNLASIAVKLSTTAFFVYVLHSTITMIAVATLLSDLVILAAGIVSMHAPGNVFGFSIQFVTLRGDTARPMLRLSFPVIVEKTAFSFGKVVVNSMSTAFGALTVGALGISNNLGGLSTNPQNGFQQGGAAVISQNIGAGKHRRALGAFFRLMIINFSVGLSGCGLTLFFLPQLSALFSSGDAPFAALICAVYRYEALGAAPLGLCAAVMALLYGYGYTKLTLLLNFCRVFVFRIPLLWALEHFTSLGSQSVGIVMLASNLAVSASAVIVAFFVVRRICREQGIALFSRGEAA